MGRREERGGLEIDAKHVYSMHWWSLFWRTSCSEIEHSSYNSLSDESPLFSGLT